MISVEVQGRIILHHRGKISSDSCAEPDDASLHNDWMEHLKDENGQTDNFYLLPALRSTISAALNQSDNAHTSKYRMTGSDVCPEEVSEIASKTSIEERSTCPWFYVLNYDPHR